LAALNRLFRSVAARPGPELNNFFKLGDDIRRLHKPGGGTTMPARSTFGHYSMVTAAVAVLGGLVYAQFADHLPERMQVSNHLPQSIQIATPKALHEQNPACALAEVPDDHIFAAASVFNGVQTDLTMGKLPVVATTVRVTVDPGDKPITVFLAGYATIFNFSGAVERVARVVAMSPLLDQKVGVVGIAADRVEFPERGDCKSFAEAMMDHGNEMIRVKMLGVMFGRRPDRAPYLSRAVQLSLPDASFAVRLEQAPGSAPSGPRVLDPNQVVAVVPVIRPDLLPGEAGLAQLEAAGAIRRPLPEDIEEFTAGASRPYQSKLSPDYRLFTKFDYVITREVTLPEPSPMAQWRFLLLSGVPAPRTAAAHGMCIAQMDDFRVNNIDHCFPGSYEWAQPLRDWPAAEKLADCRLIEPPENASLEAVSVYQPEQPDKNFNEVACLLNGTCKKKPKPIDVRVEKPGDVMLVLNSSEPTTWRVSARAGSRVVGVLLISYDASTVEGLAPETPVAITDYEGRDSRPKQPQACYPVQTSHGSAYRGGPEALLFDRQVLALTGRNLDGLRGAYKLKTVAVR
jgi:hypothetical protein